MRGSTIILVFICLTIPSTFVNLYNSIYDTSNYYLHDAANHEKSFAPPTSTRVAATPPQDDVTVRPRASLVDAAQDNTTIVSALLSHNNPTNYSSSSFMILEKMQLSRERLTERVPPWMMEYFDWHREQRQRLNATNWRNQHFRFLILRCSKRDIACGGTSDRLKPLPMYLRVAYQSRRIFLIRWEQPYPLEEFLQPTIHFNWSVPHYMESRLDSHNHDVVLLNKPSIYMFERYSYDGFLEHAMATRPVILESRKQSDDGGEKYYRTLTTNNNGVETYRDIYNGLFRAIFQPAPAVAALVERQLGVMHLVPGEYSAAHVRNFYKRPMDKVSKATQKENGINAVNCASQLHPGDPIYFASDSGTSVEAVQDHAATHNFPIHTNAMIMMESDESRGAADPLHLDFAGRGNKTWPVESFYDTFVDLLVLGNARCISYGEGGYGIYANLLSFDPNCTSIHTVRVGRVSSPVPCEWKE
jgi:hypothetical protein